MKILSVYWGFCASASLFIDCKVIAASHEERFTRIKNDDAFPELSIKYCLEEAGIKAEDLDGAAIASHIQPYADTLIKKCTWSVNDYLTEQYERWKPYLIDNKTTAPKSLLDIFTEKIKIENFPGNSYWKEILPLTENERNEKFLKNRTEILAGYLKIDPSKVFSIEHHRCHAAYGYYASPFRNEKVLAFTIDGWGDGLNATIGIFDKTGKYERVFETSECNIGRIYRYITLLLGMKPNEHEYKVMGLAPYGKEKYAQKAIDVFKSTLYVDGIDFKWKIKPTDSYFWFKERLEGIRFDNIAFALQVWVEDLLCEWIKNSINKFGIDRIVISGGVAMNVKAIGKISELTEVKDIFVAGSGSDESMAIGSGICLAEDLTINLGISWNSGEVKSLPHLYLGPETDKKDVDDIISKLDIKKYEIIENITSKEIAKYLVEGNILARCVGKMEFGQRALGNRSILADPIDLRVKERINKAIKNRDFWMPFAPVIIGKYVSKYLVNPKNVHSPHMTIGFDTTLEGYNSMIAACHPADRTARPQILHKMTNPELYEILEEFEKLTGRGALLNTSFNLHGYPIVNTPKDAFYVFGNSDLDGLIINKYLIIKNNDTGF